MKLGLGLYRASLTTENFQFARQAGATHLVVHLADYFREASPSLSRGSEEAGWGLSSRRDAFWTLDELLTIKREIERHGLVWEAIENFDPVHWYDVLLDGPRRAEQMEHLKTTLRNVGKAGIPVLGYNFSIAGVWGWSRGPVARGGAVSVLFDERAIDPSLPIPNGMVWNMVYDPDAPPGFVPEVSDAELWERFEAFLREIVPVAEENGVRLAAHPDDPPVQALRGAARLVNHPDKYRRLVEIVPSPSNALEYCLGSVQEMDGGDLYESLAWHARRGQIAYVHFRNVRGKVPHYHEVFVDEGDIDMIRVLKILKEHAYDGVLIPDHTPEMTCGAPWHAGMAYAMGYMRGAMQNLGL